MTAIPLKDAPGGNPERLRAFVAWTFNGLRYLAIPTGQNVSICDENGGNYGSWRDAAGFRAHQANQNLGMITPLGGVVRLQAAILREDQSMPVISNAGDQANNPAAVSLGRLGGKAGTGAAKRRTKATYDKMVAAKKERRDCALEVLGALIECEAAIRAWMDAPCVCAPDLYRAVSRAALAIERATGTKPGQSGSAISDKP